MTNEQANYISLMERAESRLLDASWEGYIRQRSPEWATAPRSAILEANLEDLREHLNGLYNIIEAHLYPATCSWKATVKKRIPLWGPRCQPFYTTVRPRSDWQYCPWCGRPIEPLEGTPS